MFSVLSERSQFRLREAQHRWAKPTSLKSTSFEAMPQHRSFVPPGGNEVLASLEVMLPFGQMMLCLRHK